jgi:long-chain acyl-CoA synthetase
LKIGFYQGNPLKLIEDCATLKPVLFPSVPRLYNKIYSVLKGRFDTLTGCKRWLVDRGLAAKQANLDASGSVSHCFWDRLLFSKAAGILGGKVRWMFTGSAPID